MDTGISGASGSESKARGFKSPQRILVRFFEKSRDGWKAKYQALRKERKRFQNQAADATRARDSWRQRAESSEAEVERLRLALTAARSERAQDAQKKG
jgi:hypothetical protein